MMKKVLNEVYNRTPLNARPNARKPIKQGEKAKTPFGVHRSQKYMCVCQGQKAS